MPEQLQVFPWFSQRVLARCSDNSITHHDLLKQLSADRFVPYVPVLWWFGPALPCKYCIHHMLTRKKAVLEIMISMHNVAHSSSLSTECFCLLPPAPQAVHSRLLFHLAYIKILCRSISKSRHLVVVLLAQVYTLHQNHLAEALPRFCWAITVAYSNSGQPLLYASSSSTTQAASVCLPT